MDLVARKYTILMNEEPIELWIKNNQVKKAYFMGKKVNLQFDESVIEAIKDSPTRLVNGNKLTKYENFIKNISEMVNQQMELAVAKDDQEWLSRFARYNFVPPIIINDTKIN